MINPNTIRLPLELILVTAPLPASFGFDVSIIWHRKVGQKDCTWTATC
ncbi:MAG: hypothetical protein WCD89_17500 [Anaerocolumna sp.]